MADLTSLGVAGAEALQPQQINDPIRAAFYKVLARRSANQATLDTVRAADSQSLIDPIPGIVAATNPISQAIFALKSQINPDGPPIIIGGAPVRTGTVPLIGSSPVPNRVLTTAEKESIAMDLYNSLPPVASKYSREHGEDLASSGLTKALTEMEKGVPGHISPDDQNAYFMQIGHNAILNDLKKLNLTTKFEGGSILNPEGQVVTDITNEEGGSRSFTPAAAQITQEQALPAQETKFELTKSLANQLMDSIWENFKKALPQFENRGRLQNPLTPAQQPAALAQRLFSLGQTRDMAREAGQSFDNNYWTALQKTIGLSPKAVTPSKILSAIGHSPEEIKSAIDEAITNAKLPKLRSFTNPVTQYLIEDRRPSTIARGLGYTGKQTIDFQNRLNAVTKNVFEILKKRVQQPNPLESSSK